VTRQTVVYPPDKYLTGTGEGRSEEEARALAQISRFFQTTVDDTRELFYKREPSIREGVVLCRTVPDDPRERQFASMKDNGTEYTFWGEGYSPSRHPFENKFLFVRQGNIYEMDVETTQVSEFYSDSDGWACAYPKYS
jgi:hypothetical protein